MMMIANLIGFCVGLDGIMDLLRGIVASYYGLSLVIGIDSRMGFCSGGVCGTVCRSAGHV
jgi:hypothetical protein